MYNIASFVFSILTISFVVISLRLLFRNGRLPAKLIYFDEKGKGVSPYDPKKRNRIKWGYICFILSIFSMFLSIIFSGHVTKQTPEDSDSSDVLRETPALSSSIIPSITPGITPNPYGTAPDSLPNAIWLDELTPLPCHPGNYYFGGWGDKAPFDMNGVEFDHGVGMCIIGSKFEKMVEKKDAYLNIQRWDCREASVLYQFNKKYETLSFSVGIDSSDTTLFGPSEDNGIVQIVIEESSTNKELYKTNWVDYTYASPIIEIDVSNVNILRITIRSGSINRKRITKSLRVVLINPVLIPTES